MKKKSVFLGVIIGICFCLCMVTGCSQKPKNVEFSVGNQTYNGEYMGKVKRKAPEGKGSVSVSDGVNNWAYEGDFKDGKTTEGELTLYPCTVEYNGVSMIGKYSGKVKDGKFVDKGVFESNETGVEFKYDGEWENGKIVGTGNLESNNFVAKYYKVNLKGTFEGAIVKGIAQGKGKFVMAKKGNTEFEYDGEWKDGAIMGTGNLKYTDFKIVFNKEVIKGLYEGPIQNFKATGNGNFKYVEDQMTCEMVGTWKNNYLAKGTLGYFVKVVKFEFDVLNGILRPTKAQAADLLSLMNYIAYGVEFTDEAMKFIETNPNIFMAKNYAQIKALVNPSLTFNSIASSNVYGNKLMCVKNAVVIADMTNVFRQYAADKITRRLFENVGAAVCMDSSGNGYIVYSLSSKKIYNSWQTVTIYGLPASMVSESGTNGLVMVASLIQ